MNNKGYMLYELIIAFILTTIISIFLLSTCFKLSDKNQDLIYSSRMNVMQESLTSRFYEDASKSNFIFYIGSTSDSNGEVCSFMMDGREVLFGIGTRTNSENKQENYIYYDGYEEVLPSGMVFKTPAINCTTTYETNELGVYDRSSFHKISEGKKNSIIAINVGIEDTFSEKDYDINILYLYENLDETLKFQGE